MPPQWPALIKHQEHHELVTVASEREWLEDTQLCGFPYADEDRLIDCQGKLYQLDYDAGSQRVKLCDLQQRISLEDFSLLLRKHLCVENACCISKVSVNSFAEGFALLASSVNH